MNDFNGVAVRPTDGAALLAGWTHDDWVVDGTTNLFTDFAGVLIETGSSSMVPTPAPTFEIVPAPVATPAPDTPVAPSTPQPAGSCGATESFRITSGVTSDVEECFQATEETFSNSDGSEGGFLEVWSPSGGLEYDQLVVFGVADDGTGEQVSPTPSSPYHIHRYDVAPRLVSRSAVPILS